MGQPIYRLSISNKDKSERTFEDYKGNEKTSKYETVGAIFKNDDGRLSVAVDRKFKFNPEKEWLNIYVVEQRGSDDDDDKPKAKKSAPATKKVTKKAPPPADDDDDADPFED